jgi:hypothetical protein
MWDIRMLPTGKLGIEFDDNGSNYVTMLTNGAVNDGNPHTVVVARRGSNVSISIDGTMDVTQVANVPLLTLPALQVGTDPCDNDLPDPTVALVGTVTDVCLSVQ